MTSRDSTYMPFELGTVHIKDHCTPDQAPLDRASVIATTSVRDVWSNGITPEGRREDTQPYSGAIALIIILLALIAFEAPQLRRILSSLDTDLLGVRRRANAFDSHTTAESRTSVLMLILGCVCQAILLGVAIDPSTRSNGPLLGCLAALTTGYYIFQYAACSVIGYIFTDNINAAQWRKGLNLSQGVLGLTLTIPAITILYYHEATKVLLSVSLILYIAARTAYICKGFRIFYNQLSSLVYFILYLCAIETIPVIFIVDIARRLDTLM